jgi:hypothetical protein
MSDIEDAITAIDEVTADLDKPKVVRITDKKAYDVSVTTSPEIMDKIERVRSVAAGEKHVAIGVFMVDAMGRLWTDFLLEDFIGTSIGGTALLQSRVIAEYEKSR